MFLASAKVFLLPVFQVATELEPQGFGVDETVALSMERLGDGNTGIAP